MLSPRPIVRATRSLLLSLFTLLPGPPAFAIDLVNGIDVSHWQGQINWSSVKSAGYQFAFCKATEGVDFIDVNYTQNMAAASAAGVYIGPYHFARINSFESNPNDAVEEAHDFVDAIEPYYRTPGYFLRPVLDVENGPDDGRPIKPYLSQWVRDFIGVVQDRLGFAPIIYTSTHYATFLMDDDLSQYDLWLANYNYAPPQLPPESADGIFNDWSFWQYSATGAVSGIVGNVDLDVFKGTMPELLDRFLAVAPHGDFNLDGAQDGDDFLAWQRGAGATGAASSFALGDADGNFQIDLADLATWQAGFGSFDAVTPAAAVVPEPSVLLMASIVASWAVYRRARQPFALQSPFLTGSMKCI